MKQNYKLDPLFLADLKTIPFYDCIHIEDLYQQYKALAGNKTNMEPDFSLFLEEIKAGNAKPPDFGDFSEYPEYLESGYSEPELYKLNDYFMSNLKMFPKYFRPNIFLTEKYQTLQRLEDFIQKTLNEFLTGGDSVLLVSEVKHLLAKFHPEEQLAIIDKLREDKFYNIFIYINYSTTLSGKSLEPNPGAYVPKEKMMHQISKFQSELREFREKLEASIIIESKHNYTTEQSYLLYDHIIRECAEQYRNHPNARAIFSHLYWWLKKEKDMSFLPTAVKFKELIIEKYKVKDFSSQLEKENKFLDQTAQNLARIKQFELYKKSFKI